MLNQNDINELVTEVMPNVRNRVKAEIENRLVSDTLSILKSQAEKLIIKEFEEILAKEIHAAIEGEKPVIIAELQKGLRAMGKTAGEAMVANLQEKLKHSWNVTKLVEAMLR